MPNIVPALGMLQVSSLSAPAAAPRHVPAIQAMTSIAARGDLSPGASREVLGVITSAARLASEKRQDTIENTATNLEINMETPRT
jgi:hypothetical protein